MIPGANLFLAATRLIRPMPIQYLKFAARTQNSARQYVPTFEPEQTIYASVQAVSRNTYNELGLDFQKNYVKIFAATNVVDLGRDTSGDRFKFNGRLYQIESQTDWFIMDGWASCIAVDVGSAN